MTAHIALPGISPENVPATLSPDSLSILQKDMKYDGVVITDCLQMDGIHATYSTKQGAVLAIKADCDSVKVCHTFNVQKDSIDKVCEALESGIIPLGRLDKACRRVANSRGNFLDSDKALQVQSGAQSLLAINAKTEALAKVAYAQSVTVVRYQ